jgi:hypothetical protein
VHLKIFLGFYLVFAGLTYYAQHARGKPERSEVGTIAVSLGAISGPFTGAMVRHFQSCCWNNSLAIFPYSAGILGFGVAFQFVPMPPTRAARWARLSMWTLGLVGWFGGLLVSFGHALS